MVTKRNRSVLPVLFASLGIALTALPFISASALAVRPVERVDIESLFEDEEYGPQLPAREFRCEFVYEAPPPPNAVFKVCAYDCLGYGALATFPWPADLPCPGSFDDLFPNIPEGYPDPNVVR